MTWTKMIKMMHRCHANFDLRAEVKQSEFRQSVKPQIRCRGAVASFIALAFTLAGVGSKFFKEQAVPNNAYYFHGCSAPGRFAFDAADHRTTYFTCGLVVICVEGMFFGMCVFGCFNKLSKVIWWETASCIAACIVFVLTPFVLSDSICTLFSQWHSHDEVPGGKKRYPNDPGLNTACLWRDELGSDPGNEFPRIALYMDVMLTVIAFYMPLRPTAIVCISLACSLSFLGLGMATTFWSSGYYSVDGWLLPAVGLILLGMAAFRGASDQDALRWKMWKARQELQETSAMGTAMKRIATSFCDVVVPLNYDLELPSDGDSKLQTFFGTGWRCRPLDDFLSVSDACRFNELIAQTRVSNIPACISLTLRPHDEHFPMDVNVMVVIATGGSYLLGISQNSEQALPVVEGVTLQPQPACLGHVGDTLSCSGSHPGHAFTLNQQTSLSSSAPSVIATSQIFADIDNLDEIYHVGHLEHWYLDPKTIDINFDKVLGAGCFGCVYAGTLCGTPVAIKCSRPCAIETDVGLRRHLISAANEVRVLRHVRHPHVVLFHGALFASNSMRLVYEEVSGQTLLLFASGRQIPFFWQRRVLLDISSALWYLHTRVPPVVHGDLKPANTMVEFRISRCETEPLPFVKLIDFGLSRVLSPNAKSLGGTLSYRAPEVRACARPMISSDVYSFGCIVFFVSSGSEPKKLLLENESAPLKEWKQIYENCVRIDPAERPDISKIHSEITMVCPLRPI